MKLWSETVLLMSSQYFLNKNEKCFNLNTNLSQNTYQKSSCESNPVHSLYLFPRDSPAEGNKFILIFGHTFYYSSLFYSIYFITIIYSRSFTLIKTGYVFLIILSHDVIDLKDLQKRRRSKL